MTTQAQRLEDGAEQDGMSRGSIIAWCIFDWANSTFPTVIVTFVFAAYFTQAIAPTPEEGTALWGTALSLSALGVAVLGPILGAIADNSGRRKPWLFVLTVICIVPSACLWWATPEVSSLLMVLILVGVANAAFELGQVFYNAMLPEVAPKAMTGRISGWSWAMGYAGGLACLAITLLLFVQPERPLFGLDKESAETIRITGPFVAAWFAIFAVPLFLFTPDRPSTGLSIATACRKGLEELIQTLKRLSQYGNIVRYLLARMIYIDGLNTLFAFGGIYAAGRFGMEMEEVLAFGILLNVTAGLGAMSFAWLDDWIGPKRTTLISVAALTVLGALILIVESKLWFYVLGAGIGVFIGPVQSASRSLMARLAPAEIRTEMFGLYALAGKATAFVGPALVGWVTVWANSQRAGMATILVFFVVGFLLLLPVREPPR